MDGRTANTPTRVSASDVPGVPLMLRSLCSHFVLMLPGAGFQKSRTKSHSGFSYAAGRVNYYGPQNVKKLQGKQNTIIFFLNVIQV